MKSPGRILCLFVLSLSWSLPGMRGQSSPPGPSTPATPINNAEIQHLRYQVLATKDLFTCKRGSEQARRQEAAQALGEFSAIQNDTEAFQAITAHLGLQNASTFGPDEKLLIYCDYMTLSAIHLSPSGSRYKVTMEGQQPNNSVSPESGTYIDREGHFTNIIVGPLTRPTLSPPLRDIPPQPNWAPPPEPPIPIKPIDHLEIRYRLLDRFGAFLCPDDSGPAHNPLARRQRMLETFPTIRKDEPGFGAIARHLRLEDVTEFSDEQKITVYHEYRKLMSIRLEPLVKRLEFSLHATDKEKQRYGMGFMAIGLIGAQGEITVLKSQPYPLICPK